MKRFLIFLFICLFCLPQNAMAGSCQIFIRDPMLNCFVKNETEWDSSYKSGFNNMSYTTAKNLVYKTVNYSCSSSMGGYNHCHLNHACAYINELSYTEECDCPDNTFVSKLSCEYYADMYDFDPASVCFSNGTTMCPYTFCDVESDDYAWENGQCVKKASCPAGQYASGTGNSSCTACPAGKYASGTGNSSCTACPAGKYAAGTGNTSCTACPAGRYAAGTGNSSCTACPANTASCSGGSFTCKAGYYKNGSSCTACPAGCSACTSASSCSACASGYILHSNKCIKDTVLSCPPDLNVSDNGCCCVKK